jgi:hypothetical protein
MRCEIRCSRCSGIGVHVRRNTQYQRFRPLGLFIILFLSGHALAAGDNPFTKSVVIFNTICAKCHEAECSGRLSFDGAFEAYRNHIIRHHGAVSDNRRLQRELFIILNHMKEKCAYYPMDVVIPPQRIWGSELLGDMATLSERNYFIPIGYFNPGSYNLELRLEQDTKVTIHLVSERFDMVLEDCYPSRNKQIEIPFQLSEVGNYYFRIYPRQPVPIKQLVITALPLVQRPRNNSGLTSAGG